MSTDKMPEEDHRHDEGHLQSCSSRCGSQNPWSRHCMKSLLIVHAKANEQIARLAKGEYDARPVGQAPVYNNEASHNADLVWAGVLTLAQRDWHHCASGLTVATLSATIIKVYLLWFSARRRRCVFTKLDLGGMSRC